jgi:hypothetical protein
VSSIKSRRNLTLGERSACDRQSCMGNLSESILDESRAITSQMGVAMRDAIRKWAYCRCVYSGHWPERNGKRYCRLNNGKKSYGKKNRFESKTESKILKTLEGKDHSNNHYSKQINL